MFQDHRHELLAWDDFSRALVTNCAALRYKSDLWTATGLCVTDIGSSSVMGDAGIHGVASSLWRLLQVGFSEQRSRAQVSVEESTRLRK